MGDDAKLSPKATAIVKSLLVFKSGKSDFADCLIERSANNAGCVKTVTFDVKASGHAGMTLIA